MRLGAAARRLDACVLAAVPSIIRTEDRILPAAELEQRDAREDMTSGFAPPTERSLREQGVASPDGSTASGSSFDP
jgi:hypothetical protein